MSDWPWSELDLDPTADRAEIKRAYAAKLKTLDRERDVEGFQTLREAYACALLEAGTDSPKESRQETRTFDDESEAPSTKSVTQYPAASVDIHELVKQVLAAMAASPSEEALHTALYANQGLDNLVVRDHVGFALAQRIVDSPVPLHLLDALNEFFGWSDCAVQTGWPDAGFRLRMDRWLGAAHVSAWIESAEVPAFSRRHFKKIRSLLTPPRGFWKAFLLGLFPWFGLAESIERVQRHLGSRWDLFVTPEVQAYYDAIIGVRFDAIPWFAALLGQVTRVTVATVAIMAVLWPMADRGPFAISHYWLTAAALVWVLYIRLWRLLINLPYRWAAWLSRQPWLFSTALYASTIIAIVLTVGR